MALLNLLLLPILAALGLFDANGSEGGGTDAGRGNAAASGGTTSGGGATDGGNAGQGGAAGSGSAGAGAAGGAAGGTGQGGQANGQAGTSLADVEKLQRELNEARADAGKYRAAGIQAIAAALGIDLPKVKGEDGQEAQLAQLQQEITNLRTEARTSRIDAGLERVFSKLSANPRVTRPYIERQLKDLDPKAEDFETKLEQIVQAAIDEEPALKAAQAARRSGGEFNGNASSSGQPEDPAKLAALVPRG